MLQIKGLSKKFDHELFREAELYMENQELYWLQAPNGAGKSTLLRLFLGVLLPDQGEILLEGIPSHRQRRLMGYCTSGDGGFYPRLSGRKNLHYYGALRGLSNKESEKRFSDSNFFSINYLEEKVENLSLGMRQKLKVIFSQLHRPKLWLLDEPFNSLDLESRASLLRYLKQYSRENCAVFVQHDLLPDPNFCRNLKIAAGKIQRC